MSSDRFNRYDKYRILKAIDVAPGPYDSGIEEAWDYALSSGMDICLEPNSFGIYVIEYEGDKFKYNSQVGSVRKVDTSSVARRKIFQNVDELRLDRGLSVSELCNELGITQRTYYNWQNLVGEPSGSQLLELERIFNVVPGYLLGRD